MRALHDTRLRVALLGAAVAAVLSLPAALMSAHRDFYRRNFPESFRSWAKNGSFSMIDSFSLAEDNYYYAARIRHAGTHALPGDPYIRENRSPRIAATDFITFTGYGLVYRLLGDIRLAWAFSQFLFALAWVPCLYALLRGMAVKREAALAVSAGVTLFADLARAFELREGLIDTARTLLQYAFWFLGEYHYFFGPTRITGPLFTYPCLFLAGLLFVRGDEKGGRAAVVGGLAGGALAYVHSDVWVAFFAASSLYAAARCLALRAPASRPLAMLGAAAAASLPWLALNRALGSDYELLGVTWGRAPSPEALLFLGGAWLCLKERARPMALWCGCMLLGLFLACNAQVLLGWTLSQGHWRYIGNVFLALALGRALAAKARLVERDWLWLAGLALLLALPRAVSYSALHYKSYGLRASEEEAFRWLDAHAPKDSVVAALSPQTNLKIPVHSRAKTAVSFLFPVMSDIPREENADRIIYALSLYKAPLEDYLRVGMDRSGEWDRMLWTGKVDLAGQERSGSILLHFCSLPEEKVFSLLRAAARRPVADYDADYLWVGPFERALMAASAEPKAGKVFENSEIALYDLRGARPSSPSSSSTR